MKTTLWNYNLSIWLNFNCLKFFYESECYEINLFLWAYTCRSIEVSNISNPMMKALLGFLYLILYLVAFVCVCVNVCVCHRLTGPKSNFGTHTSTSYLNCFFVLFWFYGQSYPEGRKARKTAVTGISAYLWSSCLCLAHFPTIFRPRYWTMGLFHNVSWLRLAKFLKKHTHHTRL